MTSPLRDMRVICLMLVASLTIMSNSTISPALPGLEAHFADTPNAEWLVRMLVTAPSLAVAVSAPFMGMLVDRVGRRLPLLLGCFSYALLGTAGYYLDDLHLILVSRLLLGFAVSIVMTSNSAMAADYFQGPDHARVMSYQVSSAQFGGLMFVSLAGLLASLDALWPFFIYGIGFLLLPLFIRYLPEGMPRTGQTPTELVGHKQNWKMTAWFMALAAAATMVFFYIVPTQLAYHFGRMGYDNPQIVGLGLSSFMLSGGISSIASGRLKQRLGPINSAILGLFAVAGGLAGMAIFSTLTGQFLTIFLIGAGMGLVIPTFLIISFQSAPANKRGTVAGWVTSSLYLGQFVSPLISQSLIDLVGFGNTFLAFAAGTLMVAAAFHLLNRLRLI